MNIFAINPSPYKCALYLDDKRVVKMCLETTQILCTVINRLVGNGEQVTVCKSTHEGHPCVQWALKSYANYQWLDKHLYYLLEEYKNRYKREHLYHNEHTLIKSVFNVKQLYVDYYDSEFNVLQSTPFVNCAANSDLGISFKHVSDVHLAYNMYIQERWKTDKLVPRWYGWTYPKLNKDYSSVFQLIEEDYGNE